MNDDWATIRARRVLGKLSGGAAMSERVEEIRQQEDAAVVAILKEMGMPSRPALAREIHRLRTALAQAERERMTPEAAEEMLRLRDERDAARAEVERWKKRVTMLETEEKWEALKQAEADLARVRAALEWQRDADAAGDDAIWERGYNAAIEHMRAALEGRS